MTPRTTHPETPEPQSTAPGRSVGADEGLREIRAIVRDCIGETIPLRRRWVAAIMRRVVEPLTVDRDRLARDLAARDARIAELGAAQAEALSLLVPSPAERPCDCEHCYCGNSGDLAVVVAWDAERRLHDAVAAVFDRAARASLTHGGDDAKA